MIESSREPLFMKIYNMVKKTLACNVHLQKCSCFMGVSVFLFVNLLYLFLVSEA